MTLKAGLRALGLLCTLTVLVVSFQNCDSSAQFGREGSSFTEPYMPDKNPPSSNLSGGGGNGDGYGGKPTIFHQYDPSSACTEKNSFGEALPKSTIFRYSSGNGHLVRDNCKDLNDPVAIPAASLSVDGSGTQLSYASRTYGAHTPASFDVYAAACPAGWTPIAGATRTNLFIDPFLMSDINSWGRVDSTNFDVTADGVLGGLPGFLLNRAGPQEPYVRVEQSLPVARNRVYAVSVFAKANTNRSLLIQGFETNNEFEYRFDIDTGAVISDYVVGGTFIGTTSHAVADGRYITLYYRTPGSAGELNIGFAPGGDPANVGDSIFVTAPQIEDVTTYCTP